MTTPHTRSETFERCWPIILDHEGYGCWHGAGEGFQTCWGIAQKFNPDLTFPLTKEQGAQVAFERYWLKCGAEELPPPLALVHFDHSFNRGVGKGRELLEQTQDYVLYSALRLSKHYTNRLEIGRKLWDINGAGWARRVAVVLAEARALERESARRADVLILDAPGLRLRADGSFRHREMPLAEGEGIKLQISVDPKEES